MTIVRRGSPNRDTNRACSKLSSSAHLISSLAPSSVSFPEATRPNFDSARGLFYHGAVVYPPLGPASDHGADVRSTAASPPATRASSPTWVLKPSTHVRPKDLGTSCVSSVVRPSSAGPLRRPVAVRSASASGLLTSGNPWGVNTKHMHTSTTLIHGPCKDLTTNIR